MRAVHVDGAQVGDLNGGMQNNSLMIILFIHEITTQNNVILLNDGELGENSHALLNTRVPLNIHIGRLGNKGSRKRRLGKHIDTRGASPLNAGVGIDDLDHRASRHIGSPGIQ